MSKQGKASYTYFLHIGKTAIYNTLWCRTASLKLWNGDWQHSERRLFHCSLICPFDNNILAVKLSTFFPPTYGLEGAPDFWSRIFHNCLSWQWSNPGDAARWPRILFSRVSSMPRHLTLTFYLCSLGMICICIWFWNLEFVLSLLVWSYENMSSTASTPHVHHDDTKILRDDKHIYMPYWQNAILAISEFFHNKYFCSVIN